MIKTNPKIKYRDSIAYRGEGFCSMSGTGRTKNKGEIQFFGVGLTEDEKKALLDHMNPFSNRKEIKNAL